MAKILTIKEGVNIVPDIVSAVANGYRDDMILDELAEAVESKSISRGQFESAMEALELYAARFADSIKSIAEAMKQFEFNEEQPILKNRRLDLAQQVVQDVEGFNNAAQEYDSLEENEDAAPVEVEAAETNDNPKQGYKDYFMSMLKKFNAGPAELTSEQWEEIDKGWQATKESD